MTISYATAVRNARMDAVAAQFASAALIRIYDGTPPASANAALSSNNKLAEVVAGTPFAGAASGGVLTANGIATEQISDATGTAAFFRIYLADGVTCKAQGSVGTSGADLILNTLSLVAGGPFAISSCVLTEGNP